MIVIDFSGLDCSFCILARPGPGIPGRKFPQLPQPGKYKKHSGMNKFQEQVKFFPATQMCE